MYARAVPSRAWMPDKSGAGRYCGEGITARRPVPPVRAVLPYRTASRESPRRDASRVRVRRRNRSSARSSATATAALIFSARSMPFMLARHLDVGQHEVEAVALRRALRTRRRRFVRDAPRSRTLPAPPPRPPRHPRCPRPAAPTAAQLVSASAVRSTRSPRRTASATQKAAAQAARRLPATASPHDGAADKAAPSCRARHAVMRAVPPACSHAASTCARPRPVPAPRSLVVKSGSNARWRDVVGHAFAVVRDRDQHVFAVGQLGFAGRSRARSGSGSRSARRAASRRSR